MTLEIIHSKNYLIIVNESQIKPGDYFWDVDQCLFPHRVGDHDYSDVPKSWKKIAAHLPLNGSPVLEKVPLLPQVSLRELTYEERIRWFVSNYYETGMEYEHLLKMMKDEDLDHFKWYEEIVNIPKYCGVDEDVVKLCEDFYKNYETPPDLDKKSSKFISSIPAAMTRDEINAMQIGFNYGYEAAIKDEHLIDIKKVFRILEKTGVSLPELEKRIMEETSKTRWHDWAEQKTRRGANKSNV